MKPVYSFFSNICIPEKFFEEAHKKVQSRFVYDKKIKESQSLSDALALTGWNVKLGGGGNLLFLNYHNDFWLIQAELVLDTIAPYVLVNSSAKIQNEKTGIHYHFIFKNEKVEKHFLTKEFIDSDSIEQQKSLFIRSTRNLLRLGLTSKKLKKMVTELFVESIVE